MIQIDGIDRGSSIEYRGIRFAAADRHGVPVDRVDIDTPSAGTEFGAQAPQVGGTLEQMLGAEQLEQSEDCLFLNVYTPGGDRGERPVLVFVHGGSFLTGTAAMAWYDGARMAARGDVVVVTVNYRLGAFGFLDDTNLGTLDQVSALRWVQRHIGDFGGDAGNVTIFGESAGGSSVVALMAVDDARDLFHKVWSMSPSLTQYRSASTAADLTQRFLEVCGTGRAGLLDLAVDEVLTAQADFVGSVTGFQHFSPTHPSKVFPDPILERAADDARPLVLGTNRDEMLLFTAFDPARADWDDDDVRTQFGHRFGDAADEAITRYRAARPNRDASRLVAAMQTDEVFRRPAQRLAESRTSGAGLTWMYEFEMESTAFGGKLGACHGLDLPYAFDNLDSHGAEMFTGPGEHRHAVAARLSGAIVEFARTGIAPWVRFTLVDRATQRIGPIDDIVLDPEPELREVWDRS